MSTLKMLIERLRQQVLATGTSVFEHGRIAEPALAVHADVAGVLAALADEREATYPLRDELTRALLAMHRHHKSTLWSSMLAVAYFFVFLTVGQWQGTFFTAPDQPSSSFMYFSLTTITTVGYGDLTAQTHLGRLLATSEAVVGQVYLVTFVAMIVGLRAQEWRARGNGRLDPPADAEEPAES